MFNVVFMHIKKLTGETGWETKNWRLSRRVSGRSFISFPFPFPSLFPSLPFPLI